MALVSIVRLPRDAMSSKRPNLTLDEQSFQGLLSAAFTIQEHNERLKQTRQEPAEPVVAQDSELPPKTEAHTDPEATSVCPQCGGEKPADRDRCESCAGEELRPGERLQRNWASMWMMSQEKGLWPERSPETRESTETEKGGPPLAAQSKPQAQPLDDLSASGDLLAGDRRSGKAALDDLTLDELTRHTSTSQRPTMPSLTKPPGEALGSAQSPLNRRKKTGRQNTRMGPTPTEPSSPSRCLPATLFLRRRPATAPPVPAFSV